MLFPVEFLLPKGYGKCFQGTPLRFSWRKYSYIAESLELLAVSWLAARSSQPTASRMDFFYQCISVQSIAMTNKEILQADLLDILFEHRNKAYGAYALRKNYNDRLHWALGISLGSVFILILILNHKANSSPS